MICAQGLNPKQSKEEDPIDESAPNMVLCCVLIAFFIYNFYLLLTKLTLIVIMFQHKKWTKNIHFHKSHKRNDQSFGDIEGGQ